VATPVLPATNRRVILPGPKLPPLALWIVGLLVAAGVVVYGVLVRRRREA
jgi:hypothetical protein